MQWYSQLSTYNINLHDRAGIFASLLYTVKQKSSLFDYIFWYADNSAVPASIEMRLTQIESCVFWDHKVYFYKSTCANTYQHECTKSTSDSAIELTFNTLSQV